MENTTGKKQEGIVKGTPNRLTKELRSVLKDIVYQELIKIEERLNDLEPKKRLELVLKLMPYAHLIREWIKSYSKKDVLRLIMQRLLLNPFIKL